MVRLVVLKDSIAIRIFTKRGPRPKISITGTHQERAALRKALGLCIQDHTTTFGEVKILPIVPNAPQQRTPAYTID
jgi:hypothetical protein